MSYLMFGFQNVLDSIVDITNKYSDIEFYNYDCWPTIFEFTLLDDGINYDKFHKNIESIIEEIKEKWQSPVYNIDHEIWDDESDPDYHYAEAKITITRLDFMG